MLAVQANIDPAVLPVLPVLRKQAGFTQKAIAERLGVTATEICRLERSVAPGGLLTRYLDMLADEQANQQ